MELKVSLCSMQCCEAIPAAQYIIQEDNEDPTAVIHLIPNSEKGEIILDRLGIEDLIEVLTMFKSRM